MATLQTRATQAGQRARIGFDVHEYRHEPGAEAYGLEAATALGLDPARVFKTLIVDLDHATVFVSAGRRGLEIELAPADLVALTAAEVHRLRRDAGA
jgi:prolyl-tRNA editing enzyme YbaK/EbsC (Cys-tRNA(Pro) deacylase)